MFVPKAGGRNTRRRQRTSSDDSVNPPKAKRQRSVLRRPDESPSDTNLGRELAKLATPTAPNGDNITPTDQMNDLHISTRVVKQGDGSGNNNEGSIVLVGYLNIFARSFRPSSQSANLLGLKSSTDFYTVDQLPSLPDQIRGLQSGISNSIAFPHLGVAVC